MVKLEDSVNYPDIKLPIDKYLFSHKGARQGRWLYSKTRIKVLHSLDGENYAIYDSLEVNSPDLFIQKFPKPFISKISNEEFMSYTDR